VTTVHGTPPPWPLRTGALHLALAAAVLVLLVRVVGVAPAPEPGPRGDAGSPPGRIAARPASPPGRAFFAAPSGRAGNSGSAMLPLDLATALSARGPVRPGDVLWIRGGTYRGNFRSDLAGTAAAFIVVAQYPGERAVLDGAADPSRDVLRIDGAYTVYWGLEVTNSAPAAPGSGRGTGINVFGPHTRIINAVVHHTGNGIGVWTPALDAEVYGNLIYEVGWDADDRGHGHSIYVQNDALTKWIVDNILFDGSSYGIHAFTYAGRIDNLHVEGNIAFDHGSRSRVSGAEANFLIGGRQVARRPVVLSNYGYYPWSSAGRNADLGYINGCTDALVRDNYLAGGTALVLTRCDGVAMSGNRFIGRIADSTVLRFRDNHYADRRPLEPAVFVRPNRYVRGRGQIAVFNWSRQRNIAVDLSSLGLIAGERFEIRDVRDYFAAPLLAGTYGDPIVVVPVHRMRAGRWDDGAGVLPPEFGAAVVLPGGDGGRHAPWSRTAAADRRWPSTVAALRPDAVAVVGGSARCPAALPRDAERDASAEAVRLGGAGPGGDVADCPGADRDGAGRSAVR